MALLQEKGGKQVVNGDNLARGNIGPVKGCVLQTQGYQYLQTNIQRGYILTQLQQD